MIIRQGDILFKRVGESTSKFRGERLVVGFGEVTGHKHQLLDATRLNGDDLAWDIFARTGNWDLRERPRFSTLGTSVVHEEHDTLQIPAGEWEVIRQREYEPDRVRFVAD